MTLNRSKTSWLISAVALTLVSLTTLTVLIQPSIVSQSTETEASAPYEEVSYPIREEIGIDARLDKPIIFLGDIMLARHVERLSLRHGLGYPYQRFIDFPLESFVVANFEAAIPIQHIPTPDFHFRFSVSPLLVPELRRFGVTHASLANNHTWDFGLGGYRNTVRVLEENHINPFGHPSLINEDSMVRLDTGNQIVSIVGLMAIDNEPDYAALKELLVSDKDSTLQVAYVHWGPEYQTAPSTQQRRVARRLVEVGFDLIIGHHPHVVQSIEVVDGVTVIYSLGNFIFDQYFSREVQEGLMLELVHRSNKFNLGLFGVTSLDSPSQPRFMSVTESETFFTWLAEISAPELRTEILAQRLTMERPVATLGESAIMAQ